MKNEFEIREALSETEDFLIQAIEKEDYEELPYLHCKIRILKWILN